MRVAIVFRGRYLVRQALELETLAAVLARAGHRVDAVYDPDVFGITDNVLKAPSLARRISTPARLAGRVLSARPDAVLFSVLPQTAGFLADAARLVREKSRAPFVLTGLYPTLSPEAALARFPGGFAVCGETEAAVPALLTQLSRGESPAGAPNLRWEEDGQIRHTPPAPLVDLDALPLPDKDLFAPWVDHSYSYPAMVSRGCPHKCSYCEETCVGRGFGPGFFRRKSVSRILEELNHARTRYRFSEIIFKDSYLSGNQAWLAELMERYRREIGVPFKCFATILGFTDETARLLARGGCYCVEFGLQTWNEDLRKRVLNRHETNGQALAAFEACARQGLWYDVDHMFHIPGETPEDHREGALAYRRLPRLNRVKPHFLVYLPGAPILAEGLARGNLTPEAVAWIEEGADTDFYDQALADPESARMVAGYANLYKILPALPMALVERLAEPARAARLSRMPQPVVALFQGAIAMRSRDRRFTLYEKNYPRLAAKSIRQALAP